MYVYFQVYIDANRHYRWRIRRMGNNVILADSAEGYVNRADCLQGISLVKTCHDAQVIDT